MKVVTINVAEPDYIEFQRIAKQRKKSTSELIREAMAAYLKDESRQSHSLLELEPLSAGKPLRPLGSREEMLGDMLDDLRP
jgi:hypothetical protein